MKIPLCFDDMAREVLIHYIRDKLTVEERLLLIEFIYYHTRLKKDKTRVSFNDVVELIQ